ncbi:MAG: carboxypeptidase-like regulatory domain-containing protein [Planctomycetota bacterium]
MDAAKRPLKGVRVRLLQGFDEIRPRRVDSMGETVTNVKVTHETITDSIGRFWLTNEQAVEPRVTISLQQSILVMDSQGWLPEIRPLNHPVAYIQAEPKSIGAVRFIGIDKQPVTDVTADCIGGDWPDAALQPSAKMGLRLTADRQGVIQFPVGTAGTCIWVHAHRYLPCALRLQAAATQNRHERGFELFQATMEPTELELVPSGEAIGRVVDETGTPVPNMAIVGLVRPVGAAVGQRRQIDLRGIETVSDELGRFRLTGLPRDWIQLIAFDQVRSGEAESLVTGVPWQAGDIVVRSMRHVRGIAWDSGRNGPLIPKDEVRIAFRSRELGTRWSAAVDQRGEFILHVPPSVKGQLQLSPHPSLVQIGVGVAVDEKSKTELVVRVQEVAATLPDAEVAVHLNDFPRDYALAEKEFVRHIPPPFTKSRQAFWQSLRQRAQTLPVWMKSSQLAQSQLENQPNAMIFVVDDRGSFHCVHASSGDVFLATLLHHTFPQFPASRIRFPQMNWNGQPFDKLTYSGDIVLRERLPVAQAISKLELILQNDCHLPVQLVVDSEMIEALHVRGRLDTGSFKRKRVPIKLASDASAGPYGRSGTPTDLIANVAISLGLDYLFEADITGDAPLTWEVSWPPFVPPGDTDRVVNEKKRITLMRQRAPAVLREQLGLEVNIHTVSLPRITVSPRSR